MKYKKETKKVIAQIYFKDFLSNIRLTTYQVDCLKKGHKTLRERLENDGDLSDVIISTFLQGSYKRSTAVRPKGDSRSDVDVVVVTNLDSKEYTPQQALDLFIPFLDKYYKNKYRIQGRSIGIELSYVDLDIVPTSAPSEAQSEAIKHSMLFRSEDILEDYDGQSIFDLAFCSDEWKNESLLIPNREANNWDRTHPLMQINWTLEKNKKTNSHYINVVKCLKWWRKEKHPEVKQPKSYPLEHFIGQCCPDEIDSVAEGVVCTLENIVNNYKCKPFLPDHGVEEHDVFARITEEEYNDFYDSVCVAAEIAREAYDCEDLERSVIKWRELFGNKFPEPTPTKNSSNGGFTQRKEKTTGIPKGRFA